MTHESFLKERALCVFIPQKTWPATIHHFFASKETDGFERQIGVINFCPSHRSENGMAGLKVKRDQIMNTQMTGSSEGIYRMGQK